MGYEVINRHGDEDEEEDDSNVVGNKIVTTGDEADEDERPKPEMGERGENDKVPDLHDITIDQIDGTDIGIVPAIKPEVGEDDNQREIDSIRRTILEDGVLDKIDFPRQYDIEAKNKTN